MRSTSRLILCIGLFYCHVALTQTTAPRLQNSSTYAADAFRAQYAALSKMPSVAVQYTKFGTVEAVDGNTGINLRGLLRASQGDSGAAVLEEFRDVLLGSGGEVLTVELNQPYFDSRTIRLRQSIRGIPVINGYVVIWIDKETGDVKSLRSRFVPDRDLPKGSLISAAKALEIAERFTNQRSDVEKPSADAQGTPQLAYFAGGREPQTPSLVWKVMVHFLYVNKGSMDEEVLVDATTGEIRNSEPLRTAAKRPTLVPASRS